MKPVLSRTPALGSCDLRSQGAPGLCQCGCGLPAPIARWSDTAAGYRKGEPKRFILGHSKRGQPSPLRKPVKDYGTKLCDCGCGLPAPIARSNNPKAGYSKGQPMRFIRGHVQRTLKGLHAGSWKGGRTICDQGYVHIHLPDHPRAKTNGYIAEHILVVEAALGRYLVRPELVHHVNGIRTDNRPANLVLCPDDAYHALLHRRMRALDACGHADWRKCPFCKSYSDPREMGSSRAPRGRRLYHHRECVNESNRRGNARRKAGCAA